MPMPTMAMGPALVAPSKYFPNCVFLCMRALFNNIDNTEPQKDTVRNKSKKGASYSNSSTRLTAAKGVMIKK
jgi:hypothetical protein